MGCGASAGKYAADTVGDAPMPRGSVREPAEVLATESARACFYYRVVDLNVLQYSLSFFHGYVSVGTGRLASEAVTRQATEKEKADAKHR